MLESTIDPLRYAYIFLTPFSFVFAACNFRRKIRNSVKFNTNLLQLLRITIFIPVFFFVLDK